MMGHNFGVGTLAIIGLLVIAGQVKSDNSWESIRAQSRISEKISRFAFRLYDALMGSDHGIADDENFSMSPISIWILLSMGGNGASGYTKREIEQALFWKNTLEEQIGLANLFRVYNSVHKKWETNMMNTIFYNNTYNITSSFKDMVKKYYETELMSVDFSMTDETHRAINSWVDRQTHSFIKDFMPEAKFNSNTSMLLVNGARFRGFLAMPFRETSVKKPFYMRNGNKHEVTMLHAYGVFSIGYLFPDYSAKIIKIDYEKNDQSEAISNYIIIPNHSLDGIEESLYFMSLNDFETHYYAKKMNLYLPKLKINSTFYLKSALNKLGMNKMWTREAEFRDINTEEKPMWASEVFHRASMVIDEYNNESANQRTTEPNADAENFYVDRPFLLLTVSNGAVVFLTRVVDPKSFF